MRNRVVKEISGAQKQGYAIRPRRYGVDGGRESEEQALVDVISCLAPYAAAHCRDYAKAIVSILVVPAHSSSRLHPAIRGVQTPCEQSDLLSDRQLYMPTVPEPRAQGAYGEVVRALPT